MNKIFTKKWIEHCHRNLFVLYTLAHLKQKANVRGTVLGYLWWFIEPLLLIMLYSYVVGIIFGHGGTDRILKIAIGVTLWKWWSASITMATSSFRRYKGIVTQVKMPISILPISDVCGQTYLFIFGYILLQATLLYFGFVPDVFSLVLTVISSVFIVSAIAVLMAILNVFIRDTAFLVGFGLRILFYVTPIIYDEKRVPVHYRWLVELNPLAHLVSYYNDSLLMTSHVSYTRDILVVLVAGIALWGAVLLCKKITPSIVRNV